MLVVQGGLAMDIDRGGQVEDDAPTAVCLGHHCDPRDFEAGVFLPIEQFRFTDDFDEASFCLIGDVLPHQFDAVIKEGTHVGARLFGSGENLFAPGEAAVCLAAFGGKFKQLVI